MLSERIKREFQEFVQASSALSCEQIRAEHGWNRGKYEIWRPAFKAIKLSAADRSWIDKRVRDAFRPRVDELWAERVSSDAIQDTITAAEAIACRHRLTPEQYDILTGGFTRVGVPVPPHGSTNDPERMAS